MCVSAFLLAFSFGCEGVYVCHCTLVLENVRQNNTVKENVDVCSIYD